MKIKIYHSVAGAKKAKGLVVIIDIFRATTVETYLMNKKIKRLIPTTSINYAINYKKSHPNTVLVGERKGIKIKNFDLGNSPEEINNYNFINNDVIHSTSSGTKGIINATKANEVIITSFPNIIATTKYIKSTNYQNISLICMDSKNKKYCQEDLLCACYIKNILKNKSFNIKHKLNILKYKSGQKFFKNNSIFKKEDYYLCTKIDIFNYIIKLKKDNNILYLEKELIK